MTVLQKVKMALRITTDDFNDEITDLINASLLDLKCAGITADSLITTNTQGDQQYNDLMLRAVLTYCKMNFGDLARLEDYDRLKASYDEQKAQMSMRTGFTVWQ